MEYERIHKVQGGLISPSKLRMKLIGPHNQKKKEGSNNNSSRTSPSRLEDSEFVKNSLLDDQNGGFEEEGQVTSATIHQMECVSRENGDSDHSKVAQSLRGDHLITGLVHPSRAYDDENLDYDSTSSFEFHKERSHPHHVARSFSRPMPSKWNDAEKWIMNRQNFLPASSKKMHFQNQPNRVQAGNTGRVVPGPANNYENKLSVKRVDFCVPAAQPSSEKFNSVPNTSDPITIQGGGVNPLIDLCPESKDLMEVDSKVLSCTKSLSENAAGNPTIRSVSMRDMGTEMTPIPSQEPSRTATPVGATTPLRSPTSSIPSTPRRGDPTTTPAEFCINSSPQYSTESGKKEVSDQELKLRTRREIVALGVQLGKMNIAAWASKDEKDKNASANDISDGDEVRRIEFAKRAAAWEEAEKSKHIAIFKREEIKIQAWESQQKAKLEAETRRTEAKVEQMKAQAQAKLMKEIALARQKSEEKRIAAEARKNHRAQKVAAQADYIRQSGRLPPSPFACCGWP